MTRHNTFLTNSPYIKILRLYNSVCAMAKKVALITGVTGQDGAYLVDLLLDKGYEVHGILRRASTDNLDRIQHLMDGPETPRTGFHLHYGDLTDSMMLVRLISECRPDEVYNLAAQSHVHVSFDSPEYTANVDALGALRLLEAIRITGLAETTRYYQASTSELYGEVQAVPQVETTPFYPRSPYAVSKLFAYWMTINYRESYGMHASNGILFNHESPKRGDTFVTRKITRAVAAIKKGQQECLYLGNLEAKRDWGHAYDYVEGMWRIVQHDKPGEYVLATGEAHSVREFVDAAFEAIGWSLEWEGEGLDQKAKDKKSGKVVVAVDPRFFRPAEVEFLLGDPSKAREVLGWVPTTKFHDLVKEMVEADLKALECS